MSEVPEGATLSDDGQWWWDGTDWQPVPAATADQSSGGETSDAEASDAEASDADASDAGGSEWPPAGYPANPEEWTEEQKEYWFGGAYDASEDFDVVEPDLVEVASIEGDDPDTGVA